jgi:hypothetical protein
VSCGTQRTQVRLEDPEVTGRGKPFGDGADDLRLDIADVQSPVG